MESKEDLQGLTRLSRLTARFLTVFLEKKNIVESLTFNTVSHLHKDAIKEFNENKNSDKFLAIVNSLEIEIEKLEVEDITPFDQLEIIAKYSYISAFIHDMTNRVSKYMDDVNIKKINTFLSIFNSILDISLKFLKEKEYENIDYDSYLEKLSEINKKLNNT
jgi:hypothetical protein